MKNARLEVHFWQAVLFFFLIIFRANSFSFFLFHFCAGYVKTDSLEFITTFDKIIVYSRPRNT